MLVRECKLDISDLPGAASSLGGSSVLAGQEVPAGSRGVPAGVPGQLAGEALGTRAKFSANLEHDGRSCPENRTSSGETVLRRAERQAIREWLFELQRASAKIYRRVGDQVLESWGVEPGSKGSTRAYHRVTRCMWSVWSSDGVQLLHSEEYQRSTYKGLVTCGSWSACPVCGGKIAEVRRRDAQFATDVMRSRGYVTALVTLTLPHDSSDNLGELVGRLLSQVDHVKKDRIYGWGNIEEQFGIVAPGRNGRVKSRIFAIRAFECTYGYNGWHPHLHLEMFLRPGADVQAFERLLRDAWYEVNGGQFGFKGCHAGELLPLDADRWEHGCTVTCNDGDVAAYLAKFGRPRRWDVSHELTMAQRKVGRGGSARSPHYTPLEMLALYNVTGEERYAQLWAEFGGVMFGRKMIVWSPGLREFVGLGDQELTDDEIVNDASDYKTVLAVLPAPVWSLIRTSGRRAELLDVADDGDAARVREWLFAWCRPPGPPGPSWGLSGAASRGVYDGSG